MMPGLPAPEPHRNHMTCQLPDISQVDFTCAADIEGSASLIFTLANRLQIFLPAASHAGEKAELRRQAKTWVSNVERHLGSLTMGDSLTTLDYYDLIHRIAFNAPADSGYLNRHKLNAFDSYMRGDTTVNAYTLQHTVAQEIRRRNSAFFGRPLRWESVCLDRWHKQFPGGCSITPLNDYDTLQRVTLLLSADLWAFETRNEAAYKRRLFDSHTRYLSLTDTMDTPTLSALNRFLSAGAPYLTSSDFLASEATIARSLLTHPDLNPYTRAALTLSLSAG